MGFLHGKRALIVGIANQRRPGAGDRHRQPRRGRAARVSRQRGLAPGMAAGGPGGAAPRDVGGGAGRELDPPQPVRRQTPTSSTRRWSRPASTPTTCRSWSTTSSARPSSCRSRPTSVSARRSSGRSCASSRKRSCSTGPAGAGTGRARAIPPTPSAFAASPGQLPRPGRHSRAEHHRRGGLRLRALHPAREGDLHPRGRTFFVEKYDHKERRVHVREADVDYYTDAITYTKVKILDRFEEEPAGPPAAPTARSTSPRRWWASRRSSSTPTRTSGAASWPCPRTRCTRRPTG